MKNNTKDKHAIVFIHSLFRSGSTYIYDVIKRTGRVHIYHEPMHEVIASLTSEWDELAGRKDQLKASLRHDFLTGSYFDEFAHLLPSIKKLFDTKFSFDYYFMEPGDNAPEMKAYIDLLIDGAHHAPVLQCTRTVGRIKWLKQNYVSKHIFLLRNPWDQWYSYKVDSYIATTPRVIYSQVNAPSVLKAIFEASGVFPLTGVGTKEKVAHGFSHPITPRQDYFLFFGIWIHAFISAKLECDVFIDMDELSSSEIYRKQFVAKLGEIDLIGMDFLDIRLHRSLFSEQELEFYRLTEDKAIEIYQQHGFDVEAVCEYLKKARPQSFVPPEKLANPAASILEDASRMRKLMLSRDEQITSLNQALTERDEQITSLNQALTECDEQITSLNQALTERDEQITSLNQALTEREILIQSIVNSKSWRVTAPLRRLSGMFKKNDLQVINKESENAVPMAVPGAFFTICSKNFLAHARTLYKSILPHYPDTRFFVVLCDRVDGLFDPLQEPFEFMYLEDLNLPNLAEMANRYNITEFNTAVKPFAFLRLMQEFQFDSVVYLDPDLFFVDRMTEVDQLIGNGAEAVLTPHILQPAEKDQIHDRNMLQFGIYNLGFLALRNTPSVQRFLQWWGRRLEKDCVIRLEDGIFVDQKWADLLPAFVPGARILHHPGYNVAYWNLPQRKITKKEDCWFANEQPLRFVHFSGNKLDDVMTFSRHSQQITIENVGVLRELLDTYREEVYNQGHAFYRKLPYAYSWVGETGVNLHTPPELDLATRPTQKHTSAEGEAGIVMSQSNVITPFRRRYLIVCQAFSIAKRLSGGWVPLASRTWRA
jgi:hypothetical protein